MNFFYTCSFLLFAISMSAQTFSNSKEYSYSSYSGVSAFERPPIWPECTDVNIYALRKCFDQSLSKHIADNFKIPYKLLDNLEYKQVTIDFVVKRNGNIYIRKIRGGIPEIQELARKTIASIPPLKPGELGGKKVEALYTIPINY